MRRECLWLHTVIFFEVKSAGKRRLCALTFNGSALENHRVRRLFSILAAAEKARGAA